jgi:hypothetical protein
MKRGRCAHAPIAYSSVKAIPCQTRHSLPPVAASLRLCCSSLLRARAALRRSAGSGRAPHADRRSSRATKAVRANATHRKKPARRAKHRVAIPGRGIVMRPKDAWPWPRGTAAIARATPGIVLSRAFAGRGRCACTQSISARQRDVWGHRIHLAQVGFFQCRPARYSRRARRLCRRLWMLLPSSSRRFLARLNSCEFSYAWLWHAIESLSITPSLLSARAHVLTHHAYRFVKLGRLFMPVL